MKTRNFIALITSIAIILASLIYWREYTTRDQVNFYHVLLWQMGIWLPWIIGFKALSVIVKKTNTTKFGVLMLISSGLLWVGMHFGWFFFLSSAVSPYVELEGSRYGVYRYFFIFWTLIDIGLLWFIIDKLKAAENKKLPPALLIELTRGNNKYFCEPSQIHLLAAENYYTKLFTTEGVFVIRKPLKSFHDVLPLDMFKKIHRSTIVNMNYVAELARGNDHSLEVILKDGTRRKVSRSFVKEVTLFFKERTY